MPCLEQIWDNTKAETVLNNRNLNDWRHLLFFEIVDEKQCFFKKDFISLWMLSHSVPFFFWIFHIVQLLWKIPYLQTFFWHKIWLLRFWVIKSFSHVFSKKKWSQNSNYGPLREPELYYNGDLSKWTYFKKIDWSVYHDKKVMNKLYFFCGDKFFYSYLVFYLQETLQKNQNSP